MPGIKKLFVLFDCIILRVNRWKFCLSSTTLIHNCVRSTEMGIKKRKWVQISVWNVPVLSLSAQDDSSVSSEEEAEMSEPTWLAADLGAASDLSPPSRAERMRHSPQNTHSKEDDGKDHVVADEWKWCSSGEKKKKLVLFWRLESAEYLHRMNSEAAWAAS